MAAPRRHSMACSTKPSLRSRRRILCAPHMQRRRRRHAASGPVRPRLQRPLARPHLRAAPWQLAAPHPPAASGLHAVLSQPRTAASPRAQRGRVTRGSPAGRRSGFALAWPCPPPSRWPGRSCEVRQQSEARTRTYEFMTECGTAPCKRALPCAEGSAEAVVVGWCGGQSRRHWLASLVPPAQTPPAISACVGLVATMSRQFSWHADGKHGGTIYVHDAWACPPPASAPTPRPGLCSGDVYANGACAKKHFRRRGRVEQAGTHNSGCFP